MNEKESKLLKEMIEERNLYYKKITHFLNQLQISKYLAFIVISEIFEHVINNTTKETESRKELINLIVSLRKFLIQHHIEEELGIKHEIINILQEEKDIQH